MQLIRIVIGIFIFTLANTSFSYEGIEITKGKVYTPGSAQNFEKALSDYDFVVVDFYAEWCGPCRQMHKVIDALAQDPELNNILFIKINTEEQRSISAQYHISSLPTLILFVDGKPINTLHGLREKKALKNLIKETFFE